MHNKIFSRRLPFLTAAIVTVPALYFLVQATYGASYAALGRDQGIFQYFAWAVRQGDVLYRDMRDVNGPLTTLVHLVFQLLGGEDEHRFRVLDLTITGFVFALLGACITGIGRPVDEKPTRLERAVWAGAAWVTGSATYLAHTFWDISQRETFASWFLLVSIAAQLLAASPSFRSSEKPASRSAFVLTAVAGALTITTWFSKPTFVLFLPGQLLALLWDDEALLDRRRRFWAFVVGAVVGALLNLACLAAIGDVRAFVQIMTVYAPAFYRYIWPRAIPELFLDETSRVETALGLVGCAVLVGLVLSRKMPRRALAIALLPLGALANIIAQRKGFPYHYQPLEFAARFVWLTLLVWMSERKVLPSARQFAPAVVLALVMGLDAAQQARSSPHTAAAAALWHHAHTSPERETEPYFSLWSQSFWCPWEMRLAAQYVQKHTRPDERIYVYGIDPHFMFLAKRLASTPYMYAFDLNVSAALAGGTGARPDSAARQKILDMQRQNSKDLLERFEKRPPGAFVFIEHAPLTTYEDDGPRDFAEWCPEAAEWKNARYKETIRFGVVRVFLPSVRDSDQSTKPDAAP